MDRTRRESATLEARIPVIDRQVPAPLGTATFALGWFWGPDSRFGSLAGVVRTRVGYSGGTTPDPTYRELGDHTETLQVDFDPQVLTYAELLEHFWEAHDPTSPARNVQYRRALFHHDPEQARLARETAARVEGERGRSLTTEILPASRFYRAEDYHQKYRLRRDAHWMRQLEAVYPDAQDFTDSTAAARLNGLLAGFGDREQVLALVTPLA